MLKRVLAIAAALVVMGTAVVVGASPAYAAGGGCNNWDVTASGIHWNLDVCLSATGTTQKPDYYLNTKVGIPSGCKINTYLNGSYNGYRKLVNSIACSTAALGHHGPFNVANVPYGPGLKYWTSVDVTGVAGNLTSPVWTY